MKGAFKAVLGLLLLASAAGSVKAFDMTLKKPETAQASGVVSSSEGGKLTILVGEGKKVEEKSFLMGTLTRVKGGKEKDLKAGKLVTVTYDMNDRKAILVVIAEKKDGEKK